MKTKGRRQSKNVEDMRSPVARAIQSNYQDRKDSFGDYRAVDPRSAKGPIAKKVGIDAMGKNRDLDTLASSIRKKIGKTKTSKKK